MHIIDNTPFFPSVQFSHSVLSDFLRPHGLQQIRPPCPSSLPELAQTHVHWVGDAIQPSHPLSSLSPPTFNLPESGSFPMSQFFASGGKRIGVSTLASVLPMNIKDWFPLGWTDWISVLSKGLKSFLHHHSFKAINSSVLSFLYSPTLTSIHDYWKNHSFD